MTKKNTVPIVLDAHYDLLMDVLLFRLRGERSVLERRFLPDLRAGGVNALVCSVFIDDAYVPEGALRNALDQISAFYADLEDSPSFMLCKSARECREAAASGKIAMFLSLEGAEPLGRDLLLLDIFYRLGVRMLGLAWSRRNYACDGISFLPRTAGSFEGSLTDFGRELVCRAMALGMIIDVSHLNDAGISEIAEMTDAPYIASHSNCRALCASPRNLSDAQMKELAAHGGVMGMNAFGPFAASGREERNAEALLKHLDRVVRICGAAHAGLGFDLCSGLEALKAGYSPEGDTDLFASHAEARAKFIDEVRARYTEEEAAAILGENFMRVIDAVLK
ncbi:MAG: membrane dipeptidase [Cloacibacillus sp.]